MKRGAIMAVLLVAAVLPAAVQASRQTEDARLRATLKSENRADQEPASIAESHGRARRVGDVLILKISRGADVRLRSQPKRCRDDDAQHCVIYSLVADLPSRHAYLVHEGLYEGGNAILIDDRTGRRTVLPDLLLFSPDSQEVIAVADCVHYACSHDVEIWKRSGDHFVLEWGHKAGPNSDEASIEFDRWEQADRVMVSYSTPFRHWQAVIVRQDGQWRMETIRPSGPSSRRGK